MRRESVARALLAGLWLSALEIGLVLATERSLFLSATEITRYASFALAVLPALCAVVGCLIVLSLSALERGTALTVEQHVRRISRLAGMCGLPFSIWILGSLTEGRRVRDLPARWILVALLSLALAYGLSRVVAASVRAYRTQPRRPALAIAFLFFSAITLALDMYLLRRLYPALHAALSVTSVGTALWGCAFVSTKRVQRIAPWSWALLVLVLMGLSAVEARSLAAAPNARFAIDQVAPLSGKLLNLLHRRQAPAVLSARTPAEDSQTLRVIVGAAGIDLRGRDVLLITVDALRAEYLRPYGGSGLTPAMDALAAEAAVFASAYTPTPHTSYALSSLMTAKFIRPLVTLIDSKAHHPTLAEILRQHGYRTAGFYPPAIFFVDQERFASFKNAHLGFEYVKEMFASAEERVSQLQTYLQGTEPEHPLFVWVHLFEPHEPYDPPAGLAKGDTPLQRYEGEIAAADSGVGRLVALFRAKRPDATVILTADHGEEFGEHGGYHHGTTLFDEQVRVPLIWSSPGQTRGHRIEAPVEIIDIGTTLLSALGIPREARMRGDDLGSLLVGGVTQPGLHAFSEIEGARMVTDGRMKLICGDLGCQLFDLQRDPGEREDLAHNNPSAAGRLHAALTGFIASLPRIEALAMESGGAWPEALTRARLGDTSAAPDLIPLLSSQRAGVRGAAARSLGDLAFAGARNVLATLRARESDPDVRAEAAIAGLRLGDTEARAAVADVLLPEQAQPQERMRRAALALATIGDAAGEGILLGAAMDDVLDEAQRVVALRTLAGLRSRAASRGIVPLLENVRLRQEVASALGRIGDRFAVKPLLRALAQERYPEARRAEVDALIALGAQREALAQVRRFLGTASSIPGGVQVLLQAGTLARASAAGADLLTSNAVRRGSWECLDRGCRSLLGASVTLSPTALRTPSKAIWLVQVEGSSQALRINDSAFSLNSGTREIAIDLPKGHDLTFSVQADEGVWLRALAVVPTRRDIPTPPPEPWSPSPAP